ncbi:MAG: hydroxyacid dehydrogenase [Chloroflexota bacterium]
MADRATRPSVALLIPASRQAEVLTVGSLAQLRELADVVGGDLEAAQIASALPSLLADAEVCLTGWGTPPLTTEILDGATRLRLIAHAAGSVKRLVPPGAFTRGIVVCHAANVIADAVAEYTILAILLGLRRVHEMDRALKEGVQWREAATAPQGLLASRTVGLVGMGYVGHKVARLLRGFGSRLLVHDPYLHPADATALDVQMVSLDALFQASEIVSVHAPTTPETRHLIGARQLDLLRDGGIFVNCARSWVVDQDPLLRILQSGRIWAALDVFDQEPLPVDSPFRSCPNLLLTPHQAGHTTDSYHQQGTAIVGEIERFLTGGQLRYQISPDAYARMA